MAISRRREIHTHSDNKISLFPPFPILPSGKSVPERHLITPLCTGALSGTNGLHYLGTIFAWSNCILARPWSHWCLKNTGESVSDQLHAKGPWGWGEEVQGVPHHRSLPMHALFYYQRLYPYHLDKLWRNTLQAQIAPAKELEGFRYIATKPSLKNFNKRKHKNT